MGQPGVGSGQVVEMAVELGFEGGAGPAAEGGSRGEAEGEEVASEEDGCRGGTGEVELIRDAADGFDAGRDVPWAWGASMGVRGHDEAEVFDGFGSEAAGEAADGPFARFVEVRHVMQDEGGDAFGEGARDAEAVEEGGGEGGAVGFVAGRGDAGASVAEDGAGAGGLAEVVGEDGEGDDDAGGFVGFPPGGQIGKGVQGVAGMLEDVALGVPVGFLGHAAQRIEFGEVGEPAGGLEPAQSGGRPEAACGPLEPLLPDTLEGEFVEGAAEFAAAGERFRCAGQIEASGELHAAEHAEGILAERVTDVSQAAAFEILASAEEVEELPGPWIHHEGIEGEVASGGGFARGDVRIEADFEAAVAGCDFRVPAGDAEVVDGMAEGQLDDAEGTSDEVRAAPGTERVGEGFVGGSEHLDIEVLEGMSEDGVPDTAADEVGVPEDGEFAEESGEVVGEGKDHPGGCNSGFPLSGGLSNFAA